MPNALKPAAKSCSRDFARAHSLSRPPSPSGGTSSRAGKIYLRDIIDLDATHAGSDAEGMPAPVIGPDDLSIVGASVLGESGRLSKTQAPTIALATQVKPAD